MKKNILELEGVRSLSKKEQKTIKGADKGGGIPPPPGLDACIWVRCSAITHCVSGVCVPN